MGDRKEARAQAEDYIVNSEKFKASLIPPKGKGINECIGDSGNLRQLLESLKVKYDDEDDDQFFQCNLSH